MAWERSPHFHQVLLGAPGLEPRARSHYALEIVDGGIEWLVDVQGCAPARLRDRTSVLALLDRIVAEMDLHVVSTAVHVFEGYAGITALYLLAESHLTIHTFPESGVATLNAYCCRPRAPAAWQALLSEHLGATAVVVREARRGAPR